MHGREDGTESAVAFAAILGGPTARMVTEKTGRKHCRIFGHDKSTCYELIGCPAGLGNLGWGRNRGRGARGARDTSSRDRGQGREATYAAAARLDPEQLATRSSTVEGTNVLHGFSNE